MSIHSVRFDRLPRLVLSVPSVQATSDFYARALGMTILTFGDHRKALAFGRQKLKLPEFRPTFEPKVDRSRGRRIFVSSRTRLWWMSSSTFANVTPLLW